MRGKAPPCVYPMFPPGITPAYAGKRRCTSACTLPCWDHPRVCGEKLFGEEHPHYTLGSPPRMRGKGGPPLRGGLVAGITPAYAGKSACRLSGSAYQGDHPRVCGEKAVRNGGNVVHPGSPPRMRGKATTSRQEDRAKRITPAYAGKRELALAAFARSRDHPRVCGEKALGLLRFC